MELLQAIETRRSVRAYENTPVSEAQVASLIQAAVWAPSPLHQQPWSFVVIRGEAAKAKVKELCLAAQQAVARADGPGWAAKYSFAYLDQAPVLLAVLYDPGKGGLGPFFNQPHGALAAASAAVQNLMLAAAEQGLGSLWLTFFDPAQMARALGAPEGFMVAGIIPLGVPAETPKAPPRKTPKVFNETYG